MSHRTFRTNDSVQHCPENAGSSPLTSLKERSRRRVVNLLHQSSILGFSVITRFSKYQEQRIAIWASSCSSKTCHPSSSRLSVAGLISTRGSSHLTLTDPGGGRDSIHRRTLFCPLGRNFRTFYHFIYHKCLSFTGAKPQRRGFLRDTNQYRKVVVIQSTGPSIGLAQHDCAVLLKEMGSSWIDEYEKTTHYFTLIGSGVILVNPPITNKYRLSDKAGTSASLPSELFLGGARRLRYVWKWKLPQVKLGNFTSSRNA